MLMIITTMIALIFTDIVDVFILAGGFLLLFLFLLFIFFVRERVLGGLLAL